MVEAVVLAAVEVRKGGSAVGQREGGRVGLGHVGLLGVADGKLVSKDRDVTQHHHHSVA